MKSKFVNAKSKHPAAVFCCVVQTTRLLPEHIEQALYPGGYGKNVTAYGFTVTGVETRWYMLVANQRQVTKEDLADRIAKSPHRCRNVCCVELTSISRDAIEVEVVASVAEIGGVLESRKGTSRKGTKRRNVNKHPDRQRVVNAH